MKRIIKIITPVLAISLLVFMSGCEVEKPKQEVGIEQEVQLEKDIDEKDIEIETGEVIEGVELVLGEKAKISPEDIQNIYKNDVEMLLRFNDFSGKKSPDFKMTNLEGKETRLSDYEGENIIIEFMGSWCPACVKSTQVNDEFNKVNTNAKIIGVGINDDTESLQTLIKENNITNTEYVIPEDGIMDKYDLLFVPLYVFVDSEGYIQMMLAGDVSVQMIENYAAKSFK